MSASPALLRELFDEIVDLDASARAAYLARRVIDDAELLAELDALLRADSETDSVPMLSPGWLERLGTEVTTRVGERVGEYTLNELVGAGGMGDVYLAERADGEFHQRVAIKLIRAGLSSATVIERFTEERQILARLSHPNIAALYGGGVTAAGLPYFVMEYVDGVSIDRYCADHRLSVDRRLALIADVCGAVAHAHGQLTVHRDLKPDNILVTGEGEVKLLDFGIAAALEPGGPERFGAAMTPSHAAPEVLAGDRGATAADIYSLGVVLHELVTGRRPGAHDDHDTVSMSADLAAVCRRAMAPDPDARYASVAALADDVRNVREHRPVAARGGSWLYAAGKLARRHRIATVSALLAAVIITAVVVVYTARLARERDHARDESRRAGATANVLISMFTAVDPAERGGEPLSVRELLVRARQHLDHELAEHPRARAHLYGVLGDVHTHLGHYDAAEDLFREALAVERAAGDGAAIADVLARLGNALREQTKLDEAESLIREALALRETSTGVRSLETAAALLDLATVLLDAGRFGDALELAERALAIQRDLGAEPGVIATTLGELGAIHSELGNYAVAETVYREELAATVVAVGEVHPRTAAARLDLGYALRKQGRFADAEPYYRDALALRERIYTGDHPDLAHSLNHMARLLHQQGKPAEAEPIYRRALAMRRRLYGRSHAAVGASISGLSKVLADLDRLDEAVTLALESVAIVEEIYGTSHPYVAGALGNAAELERRSGAHGQAIERFRRALALAAELLEPGNLQIAGAHFGLGRALCEDGQRGEGAEHLAEAARLRADKLDAEHPLRRDVADELARCR
jgi:serine/threonine-protein kinase